MSEITRRPRIDLRTIVLPVLFITAVSCGRVFAQASQTELAPAQSSPARAVPGEKGDFLLHVNKRVVWASTVKGPSTGGEQQRQTAAAPGASAREDRMFVVTAPGGKRQTQVILGPQDSSRTPAAIVSSTAEPLDHMRQRCMLRGKVYVAFAN